MLAFALILALTAHSALAKPTGLCLYPCDEQASSGYHSAGYTQPGLSQSGSTFGGMGSGFGQTSSGFGQTGSSFGNSFRNMFSGMQGMSGGTQGVGGRMTHGNQEDFGTVNVQPSYGSRMAQTPAHYVPTVVGHSQRVESQVPVQPHIEGMFTHSSGKASYEMNNGYMKYHQPAATQTVFSEPIIGQRLVQPTNPCQNYYDPCL